MAHDASVDALRALIGKDPLIDQLIAARHPLPKTLHAPLLARGDETVRAWLAAAAPETVLKQAGARAALTAEVAEALAGNPETSQAALESIAAHADPKLRMTLAAHPDLPAELVRRLASDRSAEVRRSIIRAHYNVDALDAPSVARLVNDPDPEVQAAIVHAALTLAQAQRLLPKLTAKSLEDVSGSLLEQSRGARLTALSADDRVTLANAVLARVEALSASKDANDRDHAVAASTSAFMALPPADQIGRFTSLVDAKHLDLARIAEHSPHAALLERIAAMATGEHLPLLGKLAQNRVLPESLQLRLVGQAARSTPKDSDDPREEALERLLGNDVAVTDKALSSAVDLVIGRGIDPDDGGVQNALFHHRNLPPQALGKLDAQLRGSEDWALTYLLQHRAEREPLIHAIRRWYDDQPALLVELKQIEALPAPRFFEELAKAKTATLRAIAAFNAHTPLAAVEALTKDPDQEVSALASTHPQLSQNTLMRLVAAAPDSNHYANVRLSSANWAALAKTLPTRERRAAALRQSALAREAGR